MPRTGAHVRIEYRDRQRRVWHVSEVARLKIVSAAIDGPNVCLVIRFEREGEERFARGDSASVYVWWPWVVFPGRSAVRRGTRSASSSASRVATGSRW